MAFSTKRIIILWITITLLTFTISTFAEEAKETWGSIDDHWLWTPFEARESFVLYSEPSKSRKQVGKVEKETILYLLDMVDVHARAFLCKSR